MTFAIYNYDMQVCSFHDNLKFSAHPTLLLPTNLFLPKFHLQCVWLCPLDIWRTLSFLWHYIIFIGVCLSIDHSIYFLFGAVKKTMINTAFWSGEASFQEEHEFFSPNKSLNNAFVHLLDSLLDHFCSIYLFIVSVCIMITSGLHSLCCCWVSYFILPVIFLFSWLCHTACGISVSRPGIEPSPLTLKAES